MLPVDEYDGRPTYYARQHIISLYEENEVYEYYDEDKLGDKEDNGEIFRKYQDYRENREDSEDRVSLIVIYVLIHIFIKS